MRSAGVSIRWADQAGRPILEIEARSFSGSEVTGRGELKDAVCRLYRGGEQAGVVSAPSVVVDGAKRVLMASGGVTVKSADGENFARARSVSWDAHRQVITGRGGVAVRWRGASLEGDEFTADTGLGRVEIRSARGGKGRLG